MTYKRIIAELKKKWGKQRVCYNRHLKGVALGCAECQFNIAISILEEFTETERWVAKKWPKPNKTSEKWMRRKKK